MKFFFLGLPSMNATTMNTFQNISGNIKSKSNDVIQKEKNRNKQAIQNQKQTLIFNKIKKEINVQFEIRNKLCYSRRKNTNNEQSIPIQVLKKCIHKEFVSIIILRDTHLQISNVTATKAIKNNIIHTLKVVTEKDNHHC